MYVFKVVLIGDGGVGKSTLRRRFMGETFSGQYIMTIGADFSAKIVELDGRRVKFVIWDLAGQPHFREVRADFYRGASGALLVYDITRRETLEHVPSWMEEFVRNSGRADLAVVLVANKIDLRGQARDAITMEEGLGMCELLKARFGIPVDFIETSAKTGENVEKAFLTLASRLLEKKRSYGLT